MEDSAGTILVWNDETSVHSCTAVYGMVGQGRARSRDDQKREGGTVAHAPIVFACSTTTTTYLIFVTNPTNISVEQKNCHVEKFQISMHDKCGDF